MRHRICEATLQGLCTIGFDRLSLGLVAEIAGISRGAITHHFPSKTEILVGAFEHMTAEWKRERLAFMALQPVISAEDYLRFLWKNVFSRATYVAAIDLMVAARTDADLQERLRAVLAEWMSVRDAMAEKAIGSDVGGIPRARYMQVSLAVMRGLAIHESFDLDDRTSETLFDTWLAITTALITRTTSGGRQTRGAERSWKGLTSPADGPVL